MGEYGGKSYGLPLITEILVRNDLAATFFVETFMAEQGYPGHGESICRYLVDRGQDVQLHIHPNHHHFGLKEEGKPHPFTDSLAELPPEDRLYLLSEGANRIKQWTGKAPVAFRAGNMAADEETLEQIAQAGIHIDSSYTFPFAGGQCPFPADDPYNGSRRYGDVLELALSGFTVPKIPGMRSSKPLDLVGISFEECRDAVRRICGSGADAVLILHSFSLFKVRNVQYDGGRPNRIVERRFRRMCEWLSGNRDGFPSRTFAELATAIEEGDYEAKAVPPCRLSAARAIVRKIVQGFNCSYWT